jgi:hypothetical protein
LGTKVGPASQAQKSVRRAPDSPLEFWNELPKWGKILCYGVIAILAMSIVVRLGTAPKSFARSAWGVLQLAAAIGTLLAVHLWVVLAATMKASRIALIDALIHPIEVWRPTIHQLPRTARRVWLGCWSVTAAICAMTVIGGIRYSVIVDDWGFKKRKTKSVMAQIRDSIENKADEEASAEVVEEAVGDSAAGEEGENMADADRDPENIADDAELGKLSSECVVIGYNVDPSTGRISELVMGSLVDGEYKYVGSVTQGIAPEIQDQLLQRLPTLKRKTAVIQCPREAVWVKPEIGCRTSFKSWTDDKLMHEAAVKELVVESNEKK